MASVQVLETEVEVLKDKVEFLLQLIKVTGMDSPVNPRPVTKSAKEWYTALMNGSAGVVLPPNEEQNGSGIVSTD